MNASHRRRGISILDLDLFGVYDLHLSSLFVENGRDLHWSFGGSLLISEDYGGLDGVAVGDRLGRDGFRLDKLRSFLLD